MKAPAEGDSLLQAVKRRCEEWAEWYSTGQPYGLGYPTVAWEYRFLPSGSRAGFPPLPTHEAAEEMEQWVKDMACHHPQMACVLRCYYFEAHTLRRGAQQLGMSLTPFKWHLEMAHHWLAGRLSLAT